MKAALPGSGGARVGEVLICPADLFDEEPYEGLT